LLNLASDFSFSLLHSTSVMTATFNRNGDLVLRPQANEKLTIKSGDHYVVRTTPKGRVVLRPARVSKPASGRKAYLTPRPLSRAALARLYSEPDPSWDKIEAEAVSQSKTCLAGKRLHQF
jgi:hypothetical protein